MKFAITSKHIAFGVIVFTIEAATRQEAFSKFKNVVCNPRQWVITCNEEVKLGSAEQENTLSAEEFAEFEEFCNKWANGRMKAPEL